MEAGRLLELRPVPVVVENNEPGTGHGRGDLLARMQRHHAVVAAPDGQRRPGNLGPPGEEVPPPDLGGLQHECLAHGIGRARTRVDRLPAGD